MIWWLTVCLAVLLIGVTKSGFGSGAGLMIPPMTALAMSHIPGYGAKAGLGLLLPLLILGDVIATGQYRRMFDVRRVLKFLPGTLVGVLLGALLMSWFVNQSKEVAAALVSVEVGAECIFLVCLHWYRVWRAKGELPLFRPGILRISAVGCFAGITSTLAHAAGPIVALHLLPQRLERGVFVGTCALYFAILNTAKLPTYATVGMFQSTPPLFIASFAPLVLVGALIGFWLNRHMKDETFSTVVYAITLVLSCYLLIDGGIALAGALSTAATQPVN